MSSKTNTSVIQNQISLVGFRAVKLIFECNQKEEQATAYKPNKKPKFDLTLDDLLYSNNDKGFAKIFKIRLRVELEYDIVNFDIEYHAIFESVNPINEEFLNSDFVKISAPAIGFPFLRSYVSSISVQSGIPPIILPSINFVEWSKQGGKERKLS